MKCIDMNFRDGSKQTALQWGLSVGTGCRDFVLGLREEKRKGRSSPIQSKS